MQQSRVMMLMHMPNGEETMKSINGQTNKSILCKMRLNGKEMEAK